ncbi:MAG: hypothetical protein MUF34_04555 [Polyangiaceae bacterium]|nr:hypothetical protein [Polyangiaceae bacterium]
MPATSLPLPTPALRNQPLPALLPNDPRWRLLTPGANAPRRGRAEFVVYWAQMYRRARSNAALSYAVHEANERQLPLVVYEALRVDYPYASARFHAFVLEGARGEAARYRARGAAYAFFLPKTPAEARGVFAALAARAALVVTDDYPSFLVPAHLARTAAACPCPCVAFDDNAVTPLALFPREEYAARTLRPKLHRTLPDWFRPIAEPDCKRPPPAGLELPFEPFDVERADLASRIAALPIDQSVAAVAESPGGSDEARRRLERFVRQQLSAYPDDHNHPDRAGTSRLSPYLHFGHVSAREVALAVRDAGAPSAAGEAFLEQLLVRRTLAFNLARSNPAHRNYETAPAWAQKTLAERVRDPRPQLYGRRELVEARTGDEIWNAAQRELLATGVIHNYLRMLWGKGVMAWKATPAEAFDELVYLNDRFALDGRDPNTYTNILWCFGKHDRPWGPARPIYGTVRYMSSERARHKLDLDAYLRRWGPEKAVGAGERPKAAEAAGPKPPVEAAGPKPPVEAAGPKPPVEAARPEKAAQPRKSRSARKKLPPSTLRTRSSRHPRRSISCTRRGSSRQVGMSRGVTMAPSQSLPSEAKSSPTVRTTWARWSTMEASWPAQSGSPRKEAWYMMPTVPPESATARSCSSSRLRQLGCTPATPVWVTTKGSERSWARTASKKPLRSTWARSTKMRFSFSRLTNSAPKGLRPPASPPSAARGELVVPIFDDERCTRVTRTSRPSGRRSRASGWSSRALPPCTPKKAACLPSRRAASYSATLRTRATSPGTRSKIWRRRATFSTRVAARAPSRTAGLVVTTQMAPPICASRRRGRSACE